MPDESQEVIPTKPTPEDDLTELPRLPGDLITLPEGSCQVLDVDEEVCRHEFNLQASGSYYEGFYTI